MRFQITNAVKNLLIINVLMFLGTIAFGEGELFRGLFSLFYPENDLFKPWQLLTHMFMHGDGTHLFFNMFALWMFGTAVEMRLGTKRFLFIYFSAGIGALIFQLGFNYIEYQIELNNILSLGLNDSLIHEIVNIDATEGEYIKGEILAEKMQLIFNDVNFQGTINSDSFRSFFEMNVITNSTMVGASGCLMGILVAFGMMNPNAELMMIFLPIPIKAKYFIPGIIGLDLISAFTGQAIFSPSNTAYMAHIGGAFIGFIIMWYWKKNSMDKYRIN